MRVAVVHALAWGGAARRLQGMVQELASAERLQLAEFVVNDAFAVRGDVEARVAWTPSAEHSARAIRPVLRYRDQARNTRAWSALWRRVNAWRPDVVFLNPCRVPGGTPPLAEDSAAPVVYYCDEPRRVDYERAAGASTNVLTRLPYWPLRLSQRRADRRSISASATILTNSLYTAGAIERAYARSARVVTPGIAKAFNHTGETVAPGHVLSVGTLIPAKGHDLVIKAVAVSSIGLPVIVVGPRNVASEERRLHDLAHRLGVNLEIRVGVSDQSLADAYRGAWVTVYAARDEPLGLVAFEAQACGTPVIVVDEGGLPETVEDGVSGLVVARGATSLAAALERLSDPAVRDTLARGARHHPIPRDADAARAVLSQLNAVVAP